MPILAAVPASDVLASNETRSPTRAGLCGGCGLFFSQRYIFNTYQGYVCSTCIGNPPACASCGERFLNLYRGTTIAAALCERCFSSSLICTCGRYSGPRGDLCCTNEAPVRCLRCYRGTVSWRGGSTCTHCNRPRTTAEVTEELLPSMRPVGIELEFCSRELTNTARSKLAAWGHLHNDASIRLMGKYYETKDSTPPDPYQAWYAYELGTWPERGDVAATNVTQAAEFLRTRFDAYTNETCGLHTHVYVEDLLEAQRQNIRNWWRVHEYSFFRTLPQWRAATRYARPIANVADYTLAQTGDKYWALWPGTLREHGTYEFRLHHGTLNPKRIIPWTNLLLRFVEGYKDVAITPEQVRKKVREPKRKLFGELCTDLALPLSLRKWVLQSAETYWTRRCGLFRRGDENDAPRFDPVFTAQPLGSVDMLGAASVLFSCNVITNTTT